MRLAFDKVCAGPHDSGESALVQKIIAKRIVDLASGVSAILNGLHNKRCKLWG